VSETPDCRVVQTIEREYYLATQRDPEAMGDRERALRNHPLVLVEHHRQILNTFFAEPFRWNTFIFSAPKASAKTEIAAAVTYAFMRLFGGESYSVANDREQARNRMYTRVLEALRVMRRVSPKLFHRVIEDPEWENIERNLTITFAENEQRNPGPHILKAIASDYTGEAGALNALTVFDEIWGITSSRGERLWTEMQPKPSVPVSIRFTSSYAGFYGESKLLYGLYEQCVKPDPHNPDLQHGVRVDGLDDLPVYQHGNMICYWDEVPRMPWHTPEFLKQAEESETQGRRSEFERLWRNRWSTGLETFLDMELIAGLMASGEAAGLYNRIEGLEVYGAEAAPSPLPR